MRETHTQKMNTVALHKYANYIRVHTGIARKEIKASYSLHTAVNHEIFHWRHEWYKN